jgi:hypothetical protein
LGVLTLLTTPNPDELVWQLGNGEVRLADPLILQQMNLQRPRFLGSGGGGAVFAYSRDGIGSDVAVKISWLRSAESVEKECTILKVMEAKQVVGVERCLAKARYPSDTRRVIIVMEPVLNDSVSSVTELTSPELQTHAVHEIIRTMVQMLDANVVTADVQPLISQSTGNVIFIDMTEAQLFKEPLSFVDVALASSFCTEMLTLIPETLYPFASMALLQELQSAEQRGTHIPDEIYNVLRSQTILSQDTIDYLDARVGS